MKYENAADIFPKEILRQLQKYAAGKLVYIPAGDKKKAWGETSGYRRYLKQRNHAIRLDFERGESLDSLCGKYSLSLESIKKIVYSKEEDYMEYTNTLSSAKEFASHGRIEEWIHTYLLSDGHNKAFSDGLKIYDRYFIGPVIMPLHLFCRCCGPEENMKYQVDKEWFEKHVEKLRQVLLAVEDMPPLIANYVDGHFELNDGNHRFEALKRLGRCEYPFIIWITEKKDYDDFLAKFPV